MNRLMLLGLASLAGLATMPGCTLPPLSRSSAQAQEIEPLDDSQLTGVLIVRVEGYPREIQYYINDVAIEPEQEVQWWKDARLEVELAQGRYHVTATYLARGFAGKSQEYRIETKKPVQVLPGQETHLLAVINKDWRGFPESKTTHFREVKPLEEEVRESAAGLDNRAAASSSPQVATETASPAAPPDASLPTDEIIIHGSVDGGSEVIRIEGATASEPAASSDDIVIHGSDVTPPIDANSASSSADPTAAAVLAAPATEGEAPAASGTETASEPAVSETAAAETAVQADNGTDPTATPNADAGVAASVGLPDNADPTNEDLPQPGEPVVVGSGPASGGDAQSRAPWVTVLLDSQPSGAQVSVDEQQVGQTPVRVRLDASTDHVVQFVREGCAEHVRFISAAGWEKGRSSTIRAQLECP